MSGDGYGVEVLAFGPHPDDVELFCGGTMLRFAELGYRTGVVDLTRGELGSRGTAELRAQEAQAAARVLGLQFRENLGLPDGFVFPWSGFEAPHDRAAESHLGRVVEVLRRRRPEVVLLPWIEERHPDHAAAGILLTKAVYFAGLRRFETRPAQERFVPRQVLYYELRHRMTPTFVMDTSPVVDRKRAAIACYGSQVHAGAGGSSQARSAGARSDAGAGARAAAPGPHPGELGPQSQSRPGDGSQVGPRTLISSPLALEALEARDRYYGAMIGVRSGEPLRAPNMLGLVDPIAHFRANPFTEAHFFEALR